MSNVVPGSFGMDRKKKPDLPSWGTEDPHYSPDKFYTRGSDGQGNSSVSHVRMAPEVVGEIQSIIERRVIPEYRTAADLIRDAVVHRLKYLEDNVIDQDHDLSLTLISSTFDQAWQRKRMHEESIEKMRTGLTEALEDGNLALYRELRSHAMNIVDSMDDFYAERAMKMVKELDAALERSRDGRGGRGR